MSPLAPKYLNKAFLEKVAMVVIFLAVICYGAWRFLLWPLNQETVAVEEEIQAQQHILEQNQKLVAIEARTNRAYDAARKSLMEVIERLMPPAVNPMAWAGDALRTVALRENYRTRPRGISEVGIYIPPVTSRDGKPALLEEYMVRNEFQCSYHEFGRFLAALEKQNSLLRVEGFEMKPKKKKKGSLLINMRTAFQRFSEVGFPPGERPDADTPRLTPKESDSRAAPASAGEAG